MQSRKILSLLLGTVLLFSCTEEPKEVPPINTDPPFQGTIFLDPDILTEADPSTYENLSYAGQASRTMFDRRENDWITVDPFLFNTNFDDGLTIEIQVNPEFGTEALAKIEAEKYAEVIGRLPTGLRKDVQTVWIHKGVQLFGGGNNNLLIHTGQTALYEQDGILEETLIHEASHTSLDATHAAAQGWIDAQETDSNFISTYARDNPTREDIAESYLLYLAIRFKPATISVELTKTITETIPNRIKYFDDHPINMHPIQ